MTPTDKVLVAVGVLGLCLAAMGGVMSTVDWSAPEDDTGAAEIPEERPEDAPPNIVVILVDDAGYADFGFTGSETFATPRIDGLVAEGVRFTSAYVTAPVCSPSRAGLLAGRYQQRFGHESNPPVSGGPTAGLPVGVDTLADLLKPHGYTTGVIGKWHLGRARHFHPNERGFEYFYGFIRGERTYLPQHERGPQDMKRNKKHQAEGFDYLTDELGADAADWIGQNAHKPFFLYLSYSAVHMPLEALQNDIDAQHPDLVGKRRRLAAMTAALDRSVGVVLDALDDHALAEDTVVFFLNDNGAGRQNNGLNLPYKGGKGHLYEGGVRVPFAIRWPGTLPAGGVFDEVVSALDIAPTALVAAGAMPPANLDGVDLVPHLTSDTVDGPPHKTLYWRLGDIWAIRHENLKLVRDKDDNRELYDLAADPSETTDLSTTRTAEVAALEKRWNAWNAQLVEPAFRSATEKRRADKAEKERREREAKAKTKRKRRKKPDAP